MAKKQRRRAKAGHIRIPKLPAGGGRIRVPESDYVLELTDIKTDPSQGGDPMLTWVWEINEPEQFSGKVIRDRTVMTEKVLWKIRQILESMGVKVPKSAFDLPIKKLIGKQVGATLVDGEPYKNRIASEVGDYMDFETARASIAEEDEDLEDEELEDEEDEDADDEDEDDEEDEEDDDEEDEDEDLDELDLDDL